LSPHAGIVLAGWRKFRMGHRRPGRGVPHAVACACAGRRHTRAMGYVPLRLQPGSDLRKSLEAAACASAERSAFVVCGIGSLSNARLRLAGAESETSLTGMFEILCISGTLTSNGAHLHMAIADQHGQVLGGHVCYGNTVRTTAEVLLAQPTDWTLAREHDTSTGFSELVVRQAGKLSENGA
jgi:uncharacterized protein